MKKLLLTLTLGLSIFIPCSAQDPIFYGMTTFGGGRLSYGAIIKFNPTTNSEDTCYTFGRESYDGENPMGNLVYDAGNGLFYGMTPNGGILGYGAIISFNPITNVEDTVHCFGRGTDGQEPWENLVYDPANGLYYGMTEFGGRLDSGVIFSFNPITNAEDTVHSFGRGMDGRTPLGDLVYDEVNGLFYGMTYSGGRLDTGVIFSFNPVTYAEDTLHSFGRGTDGAQPYGDLVYDPINGFFYGLTQLGGSLKRGAIISFNPSTDAEDTVHSFGRGTDGYPPYGDLVYDAGNELFYGMTELGGSPGPGAIISFNPSTNAEDTLHSFGRGMDGAEPFSNNLVYDATNGLYYGMIPGGGSIGKGVIVSFNPNTDAEDTVHSFGRGDDGTFPSGDLVLYPPSLLGVDGLKDGSEKVNIYPNPSNGIFKLGITNQESGIRNVEVYNVLGEKIYSNYQITKSSNYQIDLSSQPSGVYLYRVNAEDGSLIGEGKLVIQK